MKQHYADPWIEYTKRYETLYWSPGKPSKGDLAIFERFVGNAVRQNKITTPKILILGATPSLRDLAARFDGDATLIDISHETINAMNMLITHNKKESVVIADWLNMPLPDNTFDIVLGDLVFENVEKQGKPKFLKEISRVLKKEGAFVHRIFFVPDDWIKEPTEIVLQKFANMKHDYDRNTELLAHLLYNSFNPETDEVDTAMIKKELDKYWNKGKLNYPDKKVEELMNRAYQMWQPFKKRWHVSYKKNMFSWMSEKFDIVDEDFARDHLFGKSFPVVVCRARKGL